ncbi:hypothetical protein, variant [Fonticula alba]|nr:hypothetical protein, variant [Fonticula alba]KCV72151.1 hypothetical protein, variant [Fonticula alba]|eukprot:XP_009493728.1 hypothetical protein, variant [Fonticula alba]
MARLIIYDLNQPHQRPVNVQVSPGRTFPIAPPGVTFSGPDPAASKAGMPSQQPGSQPPAAGSSTWTGQSASPPGPAGYGTYAGGPAGPGGTGGTPARAASLPTAGAEYGHVASSPSISFSYASALASSASSAFGPVYVHLDELEDVILPESGPVPVHLYQNRTFTSPCAFALLSRRGPEGEPSDPSPDEVDIHSAQVLLAYSRGSCVIVADGLTGRSLLSFSVDDSLPSGAAGADAQATAPGSGRTQSAPTSGPGSGSLTDRPCDEGTFFVENLAFSPCGTMLAVATHYATSVTVYDLPKMGQRASGPVARFARGARPARLSYLAFSFTSAVDSGPRRPGDRATASHHVEPALYVLAAASQRPTVHLYRVPTGGTGAAGGAGAGGAASSTSPISSPTGPPGPGGSPSKAGSSADHTGATPHATEVSFPSPSTSGVLGYVASWLPSAARAYIMSGRVTARARLPAGVTSVAACLDSHMRVLHVATACGRLYKYRVGEDDSSECVPTDENLLIGRKLVVADDEDEDGFLEIDASDFQ